MNTRTLLETDPKIAELIEREKSRQRDTVVLIASENYASRAVMEATGSVFTNKYAEGYPHRRYYGGCKNMDEAENLAISRAKELFSGEHINVQPHSGSNANLAAFITLLEPGDKGLALALDHGGHLSHGSSVNVSGRYYDFDHYKVDKESGLLDYDAIAKQAEKIKPKVIIAGFSAYARTVDFAKFGEIAKSVGAYLLADIAHIAGLVAAGVHPSPVEYADVVTTTTHKTLRGPRGAMAITKQELAKKYNAALFPRLQGGPLMHAVAAKAVGFYEALQPEFKEYATKVVENARAMAQVLEEAGLKIIGGGTDTHIVLVDLRPMKISGAKAANVLEEARIVLNKNMIPYDPEPPNVSSGIRIGTAGMTVRGMEVKDAKVLANYIVEVLKNADDDKKIKGIGKEVLSFANKFPLPGVPTSNQSQ